jgi:hypothetical protein
MILGMAIMQFVVVVYYGFLIELNVVDLVAYSATVAFSF